MLRFAAWTFAILFSLYSAAGSRADEDSMRRIEAAVTDRVCPADTAKYDPLSCDEECGGSGPGSITARILHRRRRPC